MVNKRELVILKKYEKQGWSTIRCGAPDFLFVKTKNGIIKSILFVEVKAPNSHLSYEQYIWRTVLEQKGCEYKIEVV